MNAIASHGKLLTPEQTARLAILQSVERQKIIEGIAKRLKEDEQFPSSKIGATKPKREAR